MQLIVHKLCLNKVDLIIKPFMNMHYLTASQDALQTIFKLLSCLFASIPANLPPSLRSETFSPNTPCLTHLCILTHIRGNTQTASFKLVQISFPFSRSLFCPLNTERLLLLIYFFCLDSYLAFQNVLF